MGCDDYPRPERDTAYDETLKLVGQLTGAASYGRDLLKGYQQRGAELTKLRAENADLRQKERALLDATLSALVAARMFGAGNESGWQAEVETAIDQVSARLAALADVPVRDTEERGESGPVCFCLFGESCAACGPAPDEAREVLKRLMELEDQPVTYPLDWREAWAEARRVLGETK